MRISSPFRDFYDHLQMYTYGSSKVFTRMWSNVNENPFTYPDHSHGLNYIYAPNSYEMRKCSYTTYIALGFCGTIYRYAVKSVHENGKITSRTAYSDYKSLVEEDGWNTKEEIRKNSVYFGQTKDDTLFIKYNAPIFIFGCIQWLGQESIGMVCSLNKISKRSPAQIPLKTFYFNQFISPETAWTDLTSYVDFLGTEHKTIPEMPNEVKISQHGFDKKSFRGK